MSEGDHNHRHTEQQHQPLQQQQQQYLDVSIGPCKKRPSYALDRASKQKATPHAHKKWVRLATVLAYVVAVSLAAFGLAIYYSFVWKPGNFDAQLVYPTVSNDSTFSPL